MSLYGGPDRYKKRGLSVLRLNIGRLWTYFVMIVFGIMFSTSIIIAFLAVTLYRMGRLSPEGGNFLTIIFFFLTISVFVGTAISIFVARRILKPIAKFSRAAAEVAKGNFDIRLDETESIEEIQELSRNFNLMTRELSSIETLRNDFVVNVSHEFKTPIAAIEGYATLLQDESLPQTDRRDYIRMIVDSARQLANLSENILRLSKLENQEVLVEKNEFRLDEQIRQAVLLLEPEWSRKNLNLQIDLQKSLYVGDEHLLWQIWINLLGNAVKFTPEGCDIAVKLYRNPTAVVVRIHDTGCGMTDEVRRHIFDKFYQGDTARKADGNGLGLALVKRIVELCDGSVEVQSKPGEGSIFTVSLLHPL